MAQAIDFEERNDYIGKPESQSNNQCYALPVCRIVTHIPGIMERSPAQQVYAHISCWHFTEAEVEEVIRTGKVYLKIQGFSTYPLSIHGIKPIYPGDIILTKEQIKKLKNNETF